MNLVVIINIILVVYQKFKIQLEAIGMKEVHNFDEMHWSDVQRFLEANASRIIKVLIEVAKKIESKKIEKLLEVLKTVHENKIDYKDRFTQDLIRDYILAIDKVYTSYIRKMNKTKDAIREVPKKAKNPMHDIFPSRYEPVRISGQEFRDPSQEFPEQLTNDLITKTVIDNRPNILYDTTPIKPYEGIIDSTPAKS